MDLLHITFQFYNILSQATYDIFLRTRVWFGVAAGAANLHVIWSTGGVRLFGPPCVHPSQTPRAGNKHGNPSTPSPPPPPPSSSSITQQETHPMLAKRLSFPKYEVRYNTLEAYIPSHCVTMECVLPVFFRQHGKVWGYNSSA